MMVMWDTLSIMLHLIFFHGKLENGLRNMELRNPMGV